MKKKTQKIQRIKKCGWCKTCHQLRGHAENIDVTIPLIPTCDQQNTVYYLTCHMCSKTYVGMTGQTVKRRMKHHREDKVDSHAAMSQHRLKSGCQPEFSVEVLENVLTSSGLDVVCQEDLWTDYLHPRINQTNNGNPTYNMAWEDAHIFYELKELSQKYDFTSEEFASSKISWDPEAGLL